MTRDALSFLANSKGNAPKLLAALRGIPSTMLDTAPTYVSSSQWLQNIASVTDTVTGRVFQDDIVANIMGSGATLDFQMIHNQTSPVIANSGAGLTALNALMQNTVVSATKPDGSTGNIISSNLKSTIATLPQQDVFRIQNSTISAPTISIREYFISYDIYLPSNLASILDSNYANSAYWVVLFDQKTGYYAGDFLGGDYRTSVNAQITSGGGPLYFRIRGDDVANNRANAGTTGAIPGVTNNTTIWNKNSSQAVPVGEWFKLMVYRKLPSSKDDLLTGRTWVGMHTYTNGKANATQTLHNEYQLGNPQMGVQNLPIARSFLPTNYSHAAPIDIRWCNWEWWSTAPVTLP